MGGGTGGLAMANPLKTINAMAATAKIPIFEAIILPPVFSL
jgi:hypothetical protein